MLMALIILAPDVPQYYTCDCNPPFTDFALTLIPDDDNNFVLIPDLKHFFNFASKKNGEFFRE
jgi:hypothetical protein